MRSTRPDRRGAGLLLGALLAGDDASVALERLHGDLATSCRKEHAALARADRAQRLARVKELTAQILLPAPRQIALLHPSWLLKELTTLHPAVASAVVEVLPRDLAEKLRPFERPCSLPLASRLRLARDLLARFDALDGPPVMDVSLERWLKSGPSSIASGLTRLAADESAPRHRLLPSLSRLEEPSRPLALGGAMACAVVQPLGAVERLLWRLPRHLGLWIEEARQGLAPDARWAEVLALATEETS